MFLNGKDWKCPKCKTENYIGDSVNDVATSKSLEYLENYNIKYHLFAISVVLKKYY